MYKPRIKAKTRKSDGKWIFRANCRVGNQYLMMMYLNLGTRH